jgi:DNA modification methylase
MAAIVAIRVIHVHSRERAIVHEPFAGSGTTIVAAEQSGRRCYGIESNRSIAASS